MQLFGLYGTGGCLWQDPLKPSLSMDHTKPTILEGAPQSTPKNSLWNDGVGRVQLQAGTYQGKREWMSRHTVKMAKLRSRRGRQWGSGGTTWSSICSDGPHHNLQTRRTPSTKQSHLETLDQHPWSEKDKRRMVEGVMKGGHTREQRKKKDNPSVSWSTHIWSSMDQLNFLSSIKILLVAGDKARCAQVCQRHPVSAKQSKHTCHQGTLEPNNTRSGSPTLSNNCHGLHCQITHVGRVQFHLDNHRWWLQSLATKPYQQKEWPIYISDKCSPDSESHPRW